MLKRKIWLIALTFIFSSFMTLTAQESVETAAETPVRYQFIQEFKWKPSEKASKYEIVIESMEDGKWVPEIEGLKTKDTTIQVSLYPGKKRIQIISLNKLGRRGKKTDWAEFIVLDETQPYLYADYLKKSEQWEAPLLQVTKGSDEVVEGNIASEKGDPENSFSLKGKNIFLTETRFYLLPEDEPMGSGNYYEAFNKRRKRVPLTVVRNDFERNCVVVSYNPDDLFSGYYQIVAENPGNLKDSLDLLVLANRAPEFYEDQFEFFPNYEVRILDTDKIKNNDDTLLISGTGFTGDTRFALTPSTSGIPYPFASAKERNKLELSVNDITPLGDNGEMELSFKVKASDIPPGYYNLSAENSMGNSNVFLLVRNIERESESPKIDDVSLVKMNKSNITIALKGLGLTDECTYTLVSEMSPFTGLSTRIPLSLTEKDKKGKKVSVSGSSEKIEPGKYAVMAESPFVSAVRFITINEKNKISVVKLTEEEENELFIRPVNFVALNEDGELFDEIAEETGEELVYLPNEFKTKYKYRVLFPYLELDFGLGNNYWAIKDDDVLSSRYLGFSFELLNFSFMHLGMSASWSPDANFYNAEAFLRFSTTGQDFRPYIGVGAGVNVFDSEYVGIEDFALGLIKGTPVEASFPHGVYAFADVGLSLLNFIDIRYTMHFSGADKLLGYDFFPGDYYAGTSSYFYDDLTFGARIPLGKLKTYQKPKNYTLTVNKKGVASGSDYKLRKNIKRIVFEEGITEIKEFNDSYMLTSVSIPDSVRVIGKDAFKNCYNLKEVVLPYGVEEIHAGAFEGCRSMQKITIPSTIRKISSEAFSDWKEFQYILYEWSKDDKTERDLADLPEKINFNTVFDSARTPFEVRNVLNAYGSKSTSSRSMNFIIKKDGVRYMATEFTSRINNNSDDKYSGLSTTDPMCLKYLANGDGVTFNYIGDNKTYVITIVSADGKTRFTHNFYAKEGDNSLTIPYKYFVYDQYASKSYKSIRKMDFGLFQIETLYEERFPGKRYELTVYGIETIMEKAKK